jgi:hypothetical protein
MANPKNTMEIFLLLDRSNCRKCGEKTCLAFAGAVFRGLRALEDCPKLDAATLERIAGGEREGQAGDEGYGQNLADLQQQVVDLEFAEAAKRLGISFLDDRLTLKILGKDFAIDKKGGFSSTIHINPWVAVPFLTYVLHSTDVPVTGEWISFREIEGGPERYALFKRRAEEAMKRVADIWPDLFDDIVHLFEGRHVEPQFASDISVVLQVLPRVPLMICYWRESEGIASSLNIFFDRSIGEHLDIAAVYMLAAGLTQMFEKLALQHGYPVQ